MRTAEIPTLALAEFLRFDDPRFRGPKALEELGKGEERYVRQQISRKLGFPTYTKLSARSI